MKWVQDVLPNVQGRIGVSEGQNHELGVDSDNTLDVLGFFLDNVGMDGFVGWVADFALPVK